MGFIFALGGLLILLLALLGAFFCIRWLFFRNRPPVHPDRKEVHMRERDTSESNASIPNDPSAPPQPNAARTDTGNREETFPQPGARQRPIAARPSLLDSSLSRFAIVAAIAVALLIPLLLVQNLVDERAMLYRSVVRDISRTWGGQQQLTGPILLIPYSERQLTQRLCNFTGS